MSVLTLSAKLDRTDNTTPWGFRMHGGKDFGAPLTIQRVTPGSLAAKCGLHVGDTILKIGDAPTEVLKHKEAQQHIVVAGNSLELTLQRGGSYSAPPAAPAPAQSYYTPPAASPSYAPATPASGTSQNYNVAPKPFVPGGASTVPVALNKQYNTPISMYSVDNVMNSLSNKTADMNMGPAQPQPGSNTVASSPPVHEPQSASQHDVFATKPSPAKFVPPTNNMAASKPTQSARYDDADGQEGPQYRGYTNPQTQSRTFKILQDLVDSGQDYTGPISHPTPPGASARSSSNPYSIRVPHRRVLSELTGRSSRRDSDTKSPAQQPQQQPEEDGKYVKAIVNKQYNTPIGLYSHTNVEDTLVEQSKEILTMIGDADEDASKKVYVPSTTFKMVQEDEMIKAPPAQLKPTIFKPSGAVPSVSPVMGSKPPSTSPPHPQPVIVGTVVGGSAGHSRPFQKLQQHLDSPAGNSWLPKIPTGPRKMKVGRRGEARSMATATGGRIPICESCGITIRGPFVLALEKSWCPDHFLCSNPNCRQGLIDVGFVEENGQLFCENDYEQYFAPKCGKCGKAIIGDIVSALMENYHPHCFLCCHCRQPIGGSTFHMENGQPYCEKDWGSLFQTKCYGCQFPIEPGDRWVEALNQNWHSECFNCSTCQVNLEGQSFFAKGGQPYCKKHASAGRF